ncbi:MAG TPA: hypothetical protein VEL77_15035 [Rugosimonospora sp.]|nr:hypothetical protein [Rugosimonospora sp.]
MSETLKSIAAAIAVGLVANADYFNSHSEDQLVQCALRLAVAVNDEADACGLGELGEK